MFVLGFWLKLDVSIVFGSVAVLRLRQTSHQEKKQEALHLKAVSTSGKRCA